MAPARLGLIEHPDRELDPRHVKCLQERDALRQAVAVADD
jgi:hypothetical protein